MSKTRTITLTDRAPVSIDEDVWPEIAVGRWGDNAPNQPNRKWTIRVRQHTDGRAIVYGTHSTVWQNEHDRWAGEILDALDYDRFGAAGAIHRVGANIGAPDWVINDCIADLPAEAL